MSGYRLATYQSDLGARAGVIVGESVYDAAQLTGKPEYASTMAIVEDWPRASDAIATAARKPSAKSWPLSQTHLRAPLLRPGAIYCAGANYRDHAAEMARRLNRPVEEDPR